MAHLNPRIILGVSLLLSESFHHAFEGNGEEGENTIPVTSNSTLMFNGTCSRERLRVHC